MENFVDLQDAPAQMLNIKYNCSECSSIIEIISINENENYIEFKCNHHSHMKMKIKDYLEKMKKYNNEKINNNFCERHNKEYDIYCFECDKHACDDCSKEHNFHYIIRLKDILPEDKLLFDIQEKIKNNKIKINNLEKEKISKENKLKKLLNNNINKIK